MDEGYKTKEEGLPPRGRGRDEGRVGRVVEHGITPAWAGKSRRGRPCGSIHPDDPRVGGEEPNVANPVAQWVGLPPRGRGRGDVIALGVAEVGITPAWAGKRPSAGTASWAM